MRCVQELQIKENIRYKLSSHRGRLTPAIFHPIFGQEKVTRPTRTIEVHSRLAHKRNDMRLLAPFWRAAITFSVGGGLDRARGREVESLFGLRHQQPVEIIDR